MSDIKTLEQRAMEVRRRYDEIERGKGGQPWDAAKLASGFKKDVAELIDIIQSGNRDERKLSHELADCLWSVLVIARKLDIDIEKSFWTTMGDIDNRLDGELK